MGTSWTEEMDAFLRRNWEAGMSASQLEVEIRLKFGVYKSRNSVIGRAHRLGALSGKTKPAGQRRKRGPGPERTTPFRTPPAAVTRPDKAVALPTMSAEEFIARRLGTPIVKETCKWPSDCTKSATVGAYCADHAALAYRSPPTRKRNRVFNALPEKKEQPFAVEIDIPCFLEKKDDQANSKSDNSGTGGTLALGEMQ